MAVKAAAGALAVLGALAWAAPAPATTYPTLLEVLLRAPTPADRLPDWVSGDLVVQQQGINPTSVRLALRSRGRSFFVALGQPPGVYGRPSRTSPSVACLIDVPDREPPLTDYRSGFAGGPSERTGGINCQDARILRDYTVGALLSRSERGGFAVAGLAPFGFDSVRQGARRGVVRNSVFLLRGARASKPVVLTGPAGRRVQPLGLIPSMAAPRGPRVKIGLLRRARRSGDALPPRIRRQLAGTLRRGSGSVRPLLARARSTAADGLRFWLIPDADSRRLTLVTRGRDTAGSTGSLAGGDWPRASRPFSFGSGCRPSRRSPFGPRTCDIAGVVADGYTRVGAGGRSAPIRENVFVLRGIEVYGEVAVVFSGPAGRRNAAIYAGGDQSRSQLPSNFVPEGVVELARMTARAQGDPTPEGAQVLASTLARLRPALGNPPALAAGPDRTVTVVVLRGSFGSGATALAVVAGESRRYGRPEALVVIPSAEPPDLAPLGRLRPLPLRSGSR